jgi:hypothetical protein
MRRHKRRLTIKEKNERDKLISCAKYGRSCEGGSPDRQHPMTYGEDRLAALTPIQRRLVEDNLGSLYHCTYCGCQYIRTAHGKRIIAEGTDMFGRDS